MEVYRLIRKKFAAELTGKGAAKFGARWNSIGTELIYTAENRSLAMAEVAVHLNLATLPTDFLMLTIEIPNHLFIDTIDVTLLPTNWNQFPHTIFTQQFGDTFVEKNQHLILKVPSAVTKGDFNFLINPANIEFKNVKIVNSEPFPFDRRIFEK